MWEPLLWLLVLGLGLAGSTSTPSVYDEDDGEWPGLEVGTLPGGVECGGPGPSAGFSLPSHCLSGASPKLGP